MLLALWNTAIYLGGRVGVPVLNEEALGNLRKAQSSLRTTYKKVLKGTHSTPRKV